MKMRFYGDNEERLSLFKLLFKNKKGKSHG
jgi:hypothetical protein